MSKKAKSSRKASSHNQAKKRTRDRRIDEALEDVNYLMERRQWAEASKRLHELDRTYPQRQEILWELVQVASQMGDRNTYRYACEKLFGICPRNPVLPYLLVRAYVEHGWFALAASMGRYALQQDPNNDIAEETRQLLAEIEPMLQDQVTVSGLDGADGLECLTMHDQVRSLVAQSRFAKAIEVAEKLIQRRPKFAPAYNNAADSCYLDGQVARAVNLTQRLLEIEPDNVYALGNLVRFLAALGEVEDARQNAERLKTLRPLTKDHSCKQLEAFTWIGDDAGVLEALEYGLQLNSVARALDDAFLYHLAAVAAFRLGQEDDARRYWKSALRAMPDFALAEQNLEDLKLPVSERNAPWSFSYDYFTPKNLIKDLQQRLQSNRQAKIADEAARRDLEQYLTLHPELNGLVRLLFERSDGAGRELALTLAGIFRTKAMLEAVRDFALGQQGTDKLRIKAADLANEMGLIPDGPRRTWINGGWTEIKPLKFEIFTEPIQHSHAPEVYELLKRGQMAINEGDDKRAAQLYREAFAIAPDDPVVMNNLAATLDALGHSAESEALLVQCHERHPDYLFGRVAMANLLARDGDVERARKLLEPLMDRSRLHISEVAALCVAHVNVGFAAVNRKEIESWLGMLRSIAPEHPLLAKLESRLRLLPNPAKLRDPY